MNNAIPTADQIGQHLERGARIAAPVVALLITGIALLMQLAYNLGHQLGTAVHERNDELSALHCRLLGLTPAAPTPASEPIKPADPVAPIKRLDPMPPAPHPLVVIAMELEAMSCRELRALAGIRSKRHRKAELVALLMAC